MEHHGEQPADYEVPLSRWDERALFMGFRDQKAAQVSEAMREAYELGRAETVEGDLYKFTELLVFIRNSLVFIGLFVAVGALALVVFH